MSVTFLRAAARTLAPLEASVPDGAVVGVTGEEDSGICEVAYLAAGMLQPESGSVASGEPRRLVGPTDALNLAPAATLVLHHALATRGKVVRGRARIAIERLRRQGASILVISQERNLLTTVCDEVWWFDQGRLAAKGDPREVVEAAAEHSAKRLREWGESMAQPLAPTFRRGDGRASIECIETLGASGNATSVWRSGEDVTIRVGVRFAAAVDDPVVGIMLRTRIGLEVYGTNTELERVKIGRVAAGEAVAVSFSFRCELCAQEYTVTAASHDPDGVWHEWLEDAVAVSVVDSRYTAGVANLRSRATATRLP